VVGGAGRCAKVDESARVLKPSFRAREQVDRLLEQPESLVAALGQTEHAQRGADCTRFTPASSERKLLAREYTCLVVPIEKSKAFGGPAAPRRAAGIVVGDEPNCLALKGAINRVAPQAAAL
jgi:hypothetical protein